MTFKQFIATAKKNPHDPSLRQGVVQMLFGLQVISPEVARKYLTRFNS